MKRHNFNKLQIWTEAMGLIDTAYQITATFPDSEKLGLRSQMNRYAVSIASNIAEGTSKKTNKHFIQYLETSLGSAYEWETQLIVCARRGLIKQKILEDHQDNVQKIQSKVSNFKDRLNS